MDMNLSQILNEEMQDFDFLSLNRINNEDNYFRTINSKDFQVSLIYNLINNISNRDIINNTTFIIKDNSNYMSNKYDLYMLEKSYIEIIMEFKYIFKEKKYDMTIILNGDKDDISSFEINFFNKFGEQIKYDWISNNENLEKKLIESIFGFAYDK